MGEAHQEGRQRAYFIFACLQLPFRDGKKVNLPTVFKRNAGKIFEEQEPVKRKPKATTKVLQENSPKQVQVLNHCTDDANNVDRPTRPDEKVLLQIELDSVKRELVSNF